MAQMQGSTPTRVPTMWRRSDEVAAAFVQGIQPREHKAQEGLRSITSSIGRRPSLGDNGGRG